MTDAPPSPDDPLALLKSLIACRSVTPDDDGALAVVGDALAGLGFAVERQTMTTAGTPDIDNLFATFGDGAPHLVFAGHTDVVPAGEDGAWRHEPFGGVEEGGIVFGRGAVDMKGGIACFLAATAGFLKDNAAFGGRLSFLVTGDEEGPAINGTKPMLDWALAQGHAFDAALVGEPTSVASVGDTVKIGRRGSLSGTLSAAGTQGHVAYPQLAANPVPNLLRAAAALAALDLDAGSEAFEPSNVEITGLQTATDTFNVVPARASARFNVRFNDRWTAEALKQRIAGAVADSGASNVALVWAEPASAAFFTGRGPLVDQLAAAVESVTGQTPDTSTGGGTSDARFFHGHCPVAELGLVGASMHQVDEQVPVADLRQLTRIYEAFLTRFFGGGP